MIDRARYVGDPVAMVIAETLAQAKDAAELVVVDYDPLPSVTSVAEAAEADAPRVWDENPVTSAARGISASAKPKRMADSVFMLHGATIIPS